MVEYVLRAVTSKTGEKSGVIIQTDAVGKKRTATIPPHAWVPFTAIFGIIGVTITDKAAAEKLAEFLTDLVWQSFEDC